GMNAFGLSYNTKRNLFRSQIRPILEYSLCNLPMNGKMLKQLEMTQDIALRKIFSIGPKSSAISCRLLLGLPSMELRKKILQAKWYLHLKSLSKEFAIHQIFQNSLIKHSRSIRISRKSSFHKMFQND